jgi:hypothetical protein
MERMVNIKYVTHHIKLGKSHLGCLELCTPASLHPKLHLDINFIFVSLLVPEILHVAHFFCPSGKPFLEKMKDLCQDFHYFTITSSHYFRTALFVFLVLAPWWPSQESD